MLRILDAFCCEGGAAEGYRRAFVNCSIDGVDIDGTRKEYYPFRFIEDDAVAYIREHGAEYDFIHASPPCQAFTRLKAVTGKEYPDLLEPTRQALKVTGKPYIIENVVEAPLHLPITLCGMMFDGLRVYRHRKFESNFAMFAPQHPRHIYLTNAHGSGRMDQWDDGRFISVAGNIGNWCQQAMDIHWMSSKGISQAIPPAYTKYLAQFVPNEDGIPYLLTEEFAGA